MSHQKLTTKFPTASESDLLSIGFAVADDGMQAPSGSRITLTPVDGLYFPRGDEAMNRAEAQQRAQQRRLQKDAEQHAAKRTIEQRRKMNDDQLRALSDDEFGRGRAQGYLPKLRCTTGRRGSASHDEFAWRIKAEQKGGS
jgi:hypothetical protein